MILFKAFIEFKNSKVSGKTITSDKKKYIKFHKMLSMALTRLIID